MILVCLFVSLYFLSSSAHEQSEKALNSENARLLEETAIQEEKNFLKITEMMETIDRLQESEENLLTEKCSLEEETTQLQSKQDEMEEEVEMYKKYVSEIKFQLEEKTKQAEELVSLKKRLHKMQETINASGAKEQELTSLLEEKTSELEARMTDSEECER